ncbi:hypothetical protein LXL04_029023 [Taraxacum kok-saghyz]
MQHVKGDIDGELLLGDTFPSLKFIFGRPRTSRSLDILEIALKEIERNELAEKWIWRRRDKARQSKLRSDGSQEAPETPNSHTVTDLVALLSHQDLAIELNGVEMIKQACRYFETYLQCTCQTSNQAYGKTVKPRFGKRESHLIILHTNRLRLGACALLLMAKRVQANVSSNKVSTALEKSIVLRVGLFLREPVFTHGQLYVALSRVKSRQSLKLLILDKDDNLAKNTTNDMTILAPLNAPNTDSIDPDSCTNVCIEDCYIESGDDLVAVKRGWGNLILMAMTEGKRLVNSKGTLLSL